MKISYAEGPKALENFKQTMSTLFRAQKPNPRQQPKAAATTVRKAKKADKD